MASCLRSEEWTWSSQNTDGAQRIDQQWPNYTRTIWGRKPLVRDIWEASWKSEWTITKGDSTEHDLSNNACYSSILPYLATKTRCLGPSTQQNAPNIFTLLWSFTSTVLRVRSLSKQYHRKHHSSTAKEKTSQVTKVLDSGQGKADFSRKEWLKWI